MLRRVLATLAKIETNQPGRDVAGVISEEVEAVGRNFTQFKPGDEVFGACLGTYTEYACARESDLAMNGLIKLLDFGIAELALTSDLNNNLA